jgi:hypothetical protein
MKERGGLPGGTLGVSLRSELDGAHAHVARWSGSESTAARRLCAFRAQELGWEVLVADVKKVTGLAPLALQDRQDRCPGAGRVGIPLAITAACCVAAPPHPP